MLSWQYRDHKISCKLSSLHVTELAREPVFFIYNVNHYLMTESFPHFQPPKSILAQVQLHPQVPIHTISFNCADREANEFLCQLAKDTGGRFHYYSEHGVDPDGPEPWEVGDKFLCELNMCISGSRNLSTCWYRFLVVDMLFNLKHWGFCQLGLGYIWTDLFE